MTKSKLSEIRIDGGTQAREKLDHDLVQRYAERMKEGDKFPPAIVFFDGSTLWLADGFHRYFATKSIGAYDIDVEIRHGTVRDAVLYALTANKSHGLKMSSKDIQAAVTKMLLDEEWSQWSDKKIADHIGVSRVTVGRIRRKLQEDKQIEEAGPKKFERGGKEHTMNTKSIGKTDKQFEKDLQTISADPAIRELTDTINELVEENTKLKDIIATQRWDASDIEKEDIEQTVRELRNQVKTLEAENDSLKISRDTYQARNAELMQKVKSLQNQLKKLRPDG